MKYWQIAEGNFYPRNLRKIKGYAAYDSVECMIRDIRLSKYKLLCFNDIAFSDSTRNKEFEAITETIRKAYSEVFPEKSAFEL